MTPTTDLKIPVGWYYAGRVKDLSNPSKLALPGRDLVLYRGDSGTWYAVQARCPHMGADLTKARIRGESLQCSLHQWTYNNQGKCTSIPGARPEEIPHFAQLATFSVAIRHGHLFVHTAMNEHKTLPFFTDENPADYQCSWVRELHGNNHWSVPAANAFDLAHFEFVHQRRPSHVPEMLAPHKDARQLKMNYEILSRAPADRWLVRRYGRNAQLDYTVWDGNLIVAKTTVGEFQNRMMVFIRPDGSGWKAWLFVFTPRSKSPLKKLSREMTAFFSHRFFAKECLELDGVQIHPERLGPRDQLMKEYMSWLSAH